MPEKIQTINIRIPLEIVERMEQQSPELFEHGRNYAFLRLAHEELLIDPPPLPAERRNAGALKRGAALKGKPALRRKQ